MKTKGTPVFPNKKNVKRNEQRVLHKKNIVMNEGTNCKIRTTKKEKHSKGLSTSKQTKKMLHSKLENSAPD